MPTKRRKILAKRINVLPRPWAAQLLEGERPERDTPGWHEVLQWLYFGAPVTGLPDPRSPEGYELWGDQSYADQA